MRLNYSLIFLAVVAFSCRATERKPDSWVQENSLISDCPLSQAAASGMAVIFNTRVKNKDLFGDPYLGWPIAHRNEVLESLRKRSSAVVDIPDLALNRVAINPVDEEEVIEGYNKIASDAGAKYLLLLHASGGVETKGNLFQVLYLTIVGAFIFPGNEGDAEATLQAFLYRTGATQPCFTIEVGGAAHQSLPYAFFDSKSLFIEARDNAYKEFLSLLNSAK